MLRDIKSCWKKRDLHYLPKPVRFYRICESSAVTLSYFNHHFPNRNAIKNSLKPPPSNGTLQSLTEPKPLKNGAFVGDWYVSCLEGLYHFRGSMVHFTCVTWARTKSHFHKGCSFPQKHLGEYLRTEDVSGAGMLRCPFIPSHSE